MDIHNRYVVAKGYRIAHKAKCFKAGSKFPARHLGIPEESVASHIRDGAIYDPAELRESQGPPVPIDDGLGNLPKAELADIAERYGVAVKTRMSKEDLLVAIRGAMAEPEEPEPEEPEDEEPEDEEPEDEEPEDEEPEDEEPDLR